MIGWPIAHSLSPLLHGHWFERHAIDGAYVPLPVRPEDLGHVFKALPKAGFLGWNVTLPHKEAAFALVDRLGASAAPIGAVNTVLVQPDGSLLGENTDGAGFVGNLDDQVPDWRAQERIAVILGTGGAARGVALALLEAGITSFRLVNRSPERAAALAGELKDLGCRTAEAAGFEAREAMLEGAGLLIQCTSLGMTGQAPLDVRLDRLPDDAIVADLVYRPLETELLAAARRRGLRAVDGLGMLIHQAVPGFTHWGGRVPTVDAVTHSLMQQAVGT